VAKKKEFILNDETPAQLVYPPGMGRGYDPSQVIPFMFAPPAEIPLIPESEFIPRIRDRKKYKMGLRDLFDARKIGKVKDQNGQGYCWAYSVTRTAEYVRAIANLEYVPLSAHSVACKVKGFRDEGAWCGLSAQFIRANGIVPESLWPAKSMNRAHDTAANWQEAAKFRILEDFVDLSRAVYDQNLTFNQVVSCLLQNIPCAVDFNWWGHSVCAVDVAERDGEVCLDIDNSWTESWGTNGTGLLQGSRKIPNGAVATRVINPA
jgi:C1A family cysteine protease